MSQSAALQRVMDLVHARPAETGHTAAAGHTKWLLSLSLCCPGRRMLCVEEIHLHLINECGLPGATANPPGIESLGAWPHSVVYPAIFTWNFGLLWADAKQVQWTLFSQPQMCYRNFSITTIFSFRVWLSHNIRRVDPASRFQCTQYGLHGNLL